MSNILLIGKDFPDSYEMAEALTLKGHSVFGAAQSENDAANINSSSIFATTWNKASIISAHSLIIKAETKLSSIDNAIFYFDSNYFCSIFDQEKSEEISSAVDTMINQFLFSTNELLKRIDQKKEKIIITFLVKNYPSRFESVTAGNKLQGTVPATSIISTAEAAFTAIAENFAVNVADRPYLSVILGKCAFNNEIYKNEKEIAAWLSESYSAVGSMKNPQTVKQACTWNKVGTKIQTGFSLFK